MDIVRIVSETLDIDAMTWDPVVQDAYAAWKYCINTGHNPVAVYVALATGMLFPSL